MRVKVNGELLAGGIKKGVDPNQLSYVTGPYWLRVALCGVNGITIEEFCRNQNVPTECVISKPQLSFNPNLEHVIAKINDDPVDPLYLDPTYSQFFEYVGMDVGYECMTGRQIYPEEEVLVFRQSEWTLALRKVSELAASIKQQIPSLIMETGVELGNDWLCDCHTAEEIAEKIGPIWNPENFSPFKGSEVNRADARKYAKYICAAAITVE